MADYDANYEANYDLAIIGGGLTGVSIARDAAGRGLRVIVLEQGDLGAGATAASPGLLHGNFIDLERGSLLRVRAALAERDLLLGVAPHLIRATRFVMPIHPQERPPAMLRAGSLLYDRLAEPGSHTPSRMLDLTHHEMGNPLKRSTGAAVEYSDCVIDDARLTVLTALDAAAKGASIRTGARCARADRSSEWRIAVINRGQREIFTARALVNASGAWTPTVAETIIRLPAPALTMTRSTQIVVRRLFDHRHVYVLQNEDRRLIHAIPFERDFTLIGTTEQPYAGDPSIAAPSSANVAYLCKAANRYFRESLDPADVVRATSGVFVGPRGKQGKSWRDGFMRLDRKFGEAPLLTVFGGETIGARKLAERALMKLARFFALSPSWTKHDPLPGGDFEPLDFDHRVNETLQRWPFLSSADARRMVAAYGTRIEAVLGAAASRADLGVSFGPQLTAAEVRYLMSHEWARFADDIIWRRSQLGLSMTAADISALQSFMAAQPA